ncbi:MAG: preprotein translocase subunit SecE, partial [Planctomycetes bacterium]|nr:preprotein translocase subunit SecE [Planctomycetota bacterium]
MADAGAQSPGEQDGAGGNGGALTPAGAGGPSPRAERAESPGLFFIYKPGQGSYVRWGTAIGAGVIVISFAAFLAEQLKIVTESEFVRYLIPVLALAVAAYYAFRYVGQDRGFVDFLIQTEREMKQVNWSTRREVTGHTKVVIFVLLALAMTSVNVAPSALVRSRIGAVLAAQSHVVAGAALAFAMLMSPYVDDEGSASERWYLLATFALFTAYAAVPMLATRHRYFGIAALAGVLGACLAPVYAIDRPAEAYVIALAGTALLLGCATSFVTDERVLRRLPAGAVEFVRWTAIGLTLAAGVVGLEVLQVMANDVDPYVPQTRWFIAAAFALAAA